MVYSPCRNERLSCEGGKAMSAKRRDKKNRILRSGESQEGHESEHPQVSDGAYGYRCHAEHLHASWSDRCRAGAGAHGERGQDERENRAQKAAQEVGWVIGQEEKR